MAVHASRNIFNIKPSAAYFRNKFSQTTNTIVTFRCRAAGQMKFLTHINSTLWYFLIIWLLKATDTSGSLFSQVLLRKKTFVISSWLSCTAIPCRKQYLQVKNFLLEAFFFFLSKSKLIRRLHFGSFASPQSVSFPLILGWFQLTDSF